MFLGLPRYTRDGATPSLVRRERDGSLRPFPGGDWNAWEPGRDGSAAFVYLNAVHIFDDDTVWCVDQGAPNEGVFPGYGTPAPGAQKIVQLDAGSGEILRILRFNEAMLPPGGQLNDLRRLGDLLYITDSGLGGIIVHDLVSGVSKRRLSEQHVTQSSPARIPPVLAHIHGDKPFRPPNSDLIEITPDGKWLYWASPTGPLYRTETRRLLDPEISDEALSAHVERVFDNAFSGGCTMDSNGNIYFSETATNRITVLAPDGRSTTLISDPVLVRPDGGFISQNRILYLPVKKPLGDDAGKPVYGIYALSLPDTIADIPLGTAIGSR